MKLYVVIWDYIDSGDKLHGVFLTKTMAEGFIETHCKNIPNDVYSWGEDYNPENFRIEEVILGEWIS
jgi:hypothetical protein